MVMSEPNHEAKNKAREDSFVLLESKRFKAGFGNAIIRLSALS